MKSRLKENNGMALTMVMVILVVLTFMGTAMYAYSMQSLDVVRWGTNRKKAEYIARAGIEATAFAYQDTELATSNSTNLNYENAKKFIEAGRRKYKAVAVTAEDGIEIIVQYVDDAGNTKTYNENEPDERTQIETNWVYMCRYDSALDGENNEKSKVVYVDGGNMETPTPPDREYIGCFKVTASDMPQLVHTDSTCTAGDDCTDVSHWRVENYKHFSSIGRAGEKSAVKTASVVSTNYANNWIDDSGYLRLDTALANDDSNVSKIGSLKIKYPTWFGVTSKESTLDMYAGSAVGNLSVTNPSSNDMKFTESGSHAAGLVAMNDLFVNSGIDVTPERPGFNNAPNINMLYLTGNNIVVDGDINMYAYYFSNTWWTNLWSTIGGNIRLGTVIVNVPSSVETTVDDPLPKNKGGLGQCGKIYFNGDVYVTIGTRNSGSKRYKIFSAGDIYYFDAQFQSTNNTDEKVVYGIDLLKYFLDTSISDFKYTSSVRNQFQKIIDYYYHDTYTNSYTTQHNNGKNPSMRKLNVERGSIDRVIDMIPPTESDSSYIVWE